jgi:L-ascorbate metabolism protein UlaG (beta-lactamase superfamily)
MTKSTLVLILAACLTATLTWATWAAAPASAPATTSAPDPAAKNLALEKTKDGDLAIQPINHSALRFAFKGKQYYVDPAGTAEWAKLPKADAIFITHQHPDHLAPATINLIKKDATLIFANEDSVKKASLGTALNPGDKKDVLDIKLEALPAYNTTAGRTGHPKDRKDVGYILTFGGTRVYVAGDTEATPELKALKDIDIAFLPCNLPYTMNVQECADAAKSFKPKIFYPYHQGQSDVSQFKTLLADEKGIELRVLSLP